MKKSKRKIIIFIILLLILFSIISILGYNAFNNNEKPDSVSITATEYPTIEPTEEIKLYDVTIKSYDKNILTDNISYTIKKYNSNKTISKIYENLSTKEGIVNIQLEQGEYSIISNNGVFEKEFSITENSNSQEILAENNSLYTILSNTKNACIIGDSITIGSRADGHGWFEDLIGKFKNIENVDVSAIGGQTSASIFYDEQNLDVIKNTSADTFIIALGVNDVIYRNSNSRKTSFTSAEYIANMERLIKTINDNNYPDKEKEFIFVAPFGYINKISYQLPKYIRYEDTHSEYTTELYEWCNKNGYTFVSPMNSINNSLDNFENPLEYSSDDLHPTYPIGTSLYSQSVYDSATTDKTGTLNIKQCFYYEVDRDKKDKSYKTYPIDYIETFVDSDILHDAVFTIQKYSTNEYIDLEINNNEYNYKNTSDTPCYYSLLDNNDIMKINNIPEGGYIIKMTSYNQNYTPYISTRTVFVNGGNITSNAYIYMF